MTRHRSSRIFLDALVAAADHTLARVKGLTLLLHRLRDDVARGPISVRVIDGLVYAWIHGGIRPSDYMRIAGPSGPTASRDLGDAALLIPTGQTRTRRYIPSGRLRAPDGSPS